MQSQHLVPSKASDQATPWSDTVSARLSCTICLASLAQMDSLETLDNYQITVLLTNSSVTFKKLDKTGRRLKYLFMCASDLACICLKEFRGLLINMA